MTSWSDMDYEGYRVPLDPDTADRLLAGTVAPEDAPPGYARVVSLLDAVSAEPTCDEPGRDAELVALIAAAVRSSRGEDPSSPRRFFMPLVFSRQRVAAVLIAAGLACSASLASAGALPSAAQDVASAMLAKVGISVPGPNDSAGTNPSVRGSSTETPTATSSGAGKGSVISELATTTELTGVEKGAAISTAASDGKSQAGQHGHASESSSQAPVDTPNSGGTSTADAASGGKSSSGTATANEASDGHSAAGSGDAGSGQATAEEASGGHSSAGHSHRP